MFFFFNDTATTEISTYCHTLSLHDALPISRLAQLFRCQPFGRHSAEPCLETLHRATGKLERNHGFRTLVQVHPVGHQSVIAAAVVTGAEDRKSKRLNSSH